MQFTHNTVFYNFGFFLHTENIIEESIATLFGGMRGWGGGGGRLKPGSKGTTPLYGEKSVIRPGKYGNQYKIQNGKCRMFLSGSLFDRSPFFIPLHLGLITTVALQ